MQKYDFSFGQIKLSIVADDIKYYDIDKQINSIPNIKNCQDSAEADILLQLKENETTMKIFSKEVTLKDKLLKTDLYVLLNYISYVIFTKNGHIGIHSTIVSKDGIGVMILGRVWSRQNIFGFGI